MHHTNPTNDNAVNFLKWVITDGQEYLVQNGYTDLAFGEKQMKLDKLRNDVIYTENATDRFASLKIILIIVVGVYNNQFYTGWIDSDATQKGCIEI